MLTYRESKAALIILNGGSRYKALRAAGFSHHLAEHSEAIITPEMEAEIAAMQKVLVENTLQAGLINAAEIHEYLTEAIRADIRDIRNDDGTFKPQDEWPEIWGRMVEGGDVEIERKSVRSHDGVDDFTESGDPEHGWEEAGTVITKVKLRFSKRNELVKMAMQHKAVDAMVEQKHGDVNVLVVSAETARKVVGARKRLEKVIDVKEIK